MFENILLTFLSDVKIDSYTGNVRETTYKNLIGENTMTTNESAIRYLLQGGNKLSKIFIFASKTVQKDITYFTGNGENKKINYYLDENEQPQTHLNFFKNRMGKFLPNVQECITDETVYSYDENSDNLKNLKSVAEMAELIQKFAADIKKNSDKKICLHVDLTGGMRHIIMIMLDVTRLLEYSGVTIGKLIYSNYTTNTVEEVNDVYDMFQLISGVEEFVNFGSVKVLKSYYNLHKDKIELSADLKKLIDAMENFAEEIKLCHYGQFKIAVEKLHDAINDFSANQNNLHDVFMARLIDKIREDYSMLISTRGQDDLKIIRWCLDKGYMQQALTLFTERVPEYLGEKGFIKQTEEEAKILDELVENDSMNRNKFFYLLNECSARQDHIGRSLAKYCYAIQKQATVAIKKNKFDYDEWWNKLNAELQKQNIFCTDEPRLRLQLELLSSFRKDPAILLNLSSPELSPIKEIISAIKEDLEKLDKGFARSKKIIDFLQNELQSKDINKFFPDLKFAKEIFDKYPKSFKLYEMLFEKIFSVTVPEEKFLSIMDKYFRLKDERNHSNHARQDKGEFTTAAELKDFMEKAVDDIEEAMTFLSAKNER